MYNNIIFIGGVHGVGKGTICQKIKEKLDFTHLSASEVLKWDDFKNEKGDKRVENVSTTQQRLIENLKNIVNPQKKVLIYISTLENHRKGWSREIPEPVFSIYLTILFPLLSKQKPKTYLYRLLLLPCC